MYDIYLVCYDTSLISIRYSTETLRYGVQEKKKIRTGKKAYPRRTRIARWTASGSRDTGNVAAAPLPKGDFDDPNVSLKEMWKWNTAEDSAPQHR